MSDHFLDALLLLPFYLLAVPVINFAVWATWSRQSGEKIAGLYTFAGSVAVFLGGFTLARGPDGLSAGAVLGLFCGTVAAAMVVPVVKRSPLKQWYAVAAQAETRVLLIGFFTLFVILMGLWGSGELSFASRELGLRLPALDGWHAQVFLAYCLVATLFVSFFGADSHRRGHLLTLLLPRLTSVAVVFGGTFLLLKGELEPDQALIGSAIAAPLLALLVSLERLPSRAEAETLKEGAWDLRNPQTSRSEGSERKRLHRDEQGSGAQAAHSFSTVDALDLQYDPQSRTRYSLLLAALLISALGGMVGPAGGFNVILVAGLAAASVRCVAYQIDRNAGVLRRLRPLLPRGAGDEEIPLERFQELHLPSPSAGSVRLTLKPRPGAGPPLHLTGDLSDPAEARWLAEVVTRQTDLPIRT